MALKLRFKLQIGPDTQQPNSATVQEAHAPICFVNIDKPGQIQSRANKRIIRKQAMRDVGYSRRRDVVPSSAALTPYAPTHHKIVYWADINICKNFKRLFWSMNMVSQGLLELAVVDVARSPRPRRTRHIPGCLAKPSNVTNTDLRTYTDALYLVRSSISLLNEESHLYTIIGTATCLAYFDASIAYPNRGDHLRANRDSCALVILANGTCTWRAYARFCVFLVAWRD